MFNMDGTVTAPQADVIKDATEATFMADVIEESRVVPVIVDFWAPWCGPCKTLGPALEAAVTAAKGRVKMVKINVDQNQMIAAQLRVQSIPTVYAFWQGQPVDGFQGALSPAALTKFVEKTAALGGDGGLDSAIEVAEQMLQDGEIADAIETFAAILEEEPENPVVYGALVRAFLAHGDMAQAQTLLDRVPDKIKSAKEIEAARAQIELAKQAAHAGPEAELRAAVEANQNDHQARFDLAIALNAAGKAEEAIDQLLELFRRDREWQDGAARTQLFTIFDALKPQDPLVIKGRRKLSSMIFV